MRLQEFDMHPENPQMIQEEFIEMRRLHDASADDLHTLIILSRMMGILHGKKRLDTYSWNLAKLMENERRKRIQDLKDQRKTQ